MKFIVMLLLTQFAKKRIMQIHLCIYLSQFWESSQIGILHDRIYKFMMVFVKFYIVMNILKIIYKNK